MTPTTAAILALLSFISSRLSYAEQQYLFGRFFFYAGMAFLAILLGHILTHITQ